MKVCVDKDLCIGCGICEGISAEVFAISSDGVAVVQLDPVPDDLVAVAQEAVDGCPVTAISIED